MSIKPRFWVLAVAGLAMLAAPCMAQTPIGACGMTITTPGAYVLSGNLINTAAAVCINVKAPRVTIDLAGYSIVGNGGYTGIYGDYNNVVDLTISNGTIQNFRWGIKAPAAGQTLDHVNVVGNAAAGAVVGDDARVSASDFRGNADVGLQAGNNAIVKDSTFAGNGGDGLDAAAQLRALDSTFDSNKATGLMAGAGANVTGCVAIENKGYGGFYVGDHSTFRGDSSTGSISGSGFTAGYGSTFIGNNSDLNSDYGFFEFGRSTLQANTAWDNGVDGFRGGGKYSTYTDNTSDENGTAGQGYGFEVACPDNFIGNTALNNPSQYYGPGSPPCNLVNNLGF